GQNGQPPAVVDVYLQSDELAETALFEAASKLRAKGLTVEVDVDGTQPGSVGPYNRRGDRILIKAVVMSSADGKLQFAIDSERDRSLSLEEIYQRVREMDRSSTSKGEGL